MIYRIMKRVMDILLSLVGLLILLPFFIIIAIVLKLTGEGEIFYRQKRIGFHNQKFRIWKFATMLKNSPNMLTGSLTLRNDPRVTSFGRFLRATKINELPQLFNVLWGDMSMVGPRPQMEVDFMAYPESIRKKIYMVKPGITSLGSIVYRDEEKLLSTVGGNIHEYYAEKIAPHKGRIEIWYQEKAGIFNDFMIIFLTFWTIFYPETRLAYKCFRDMPKNEF